MSIRRPLGTDTLGTQVRCDVCGRPAAWRDRVYTACCIYGEVLCDRCEGKRLARQAYGDDFWEDIVDFASWPFRRLMGALINKKLVDLQWLLPKREYQRRLTRIYLP